MSSQPFLQAVPDEPIREDSAPVETTAVGGTTPPSTPSGGSESNPNRAQKPRAEKHLPTDRLSIDKQVSALEALARHSSTAKRAVTSEQLSAALGLKGNTGGLSNKFFVDSGWALPAGRGCYVATDELLEYKQRLTFGVGDQESVKAPLVATARQTWYWTEIEHLLEDPSGVPQRSFMFELARAAGASEEHVSQLNLLVAWLEWLGLIVRDGDFVRVGPAVSAGGSDQVEDDEHEQEGQSAEAEPAAEVQTRRGEEPRPEGRISTDALVEFSFNVRVTADDAARLDREQLEQILDFARKLGGKG